MAYDIFPVIRYFVGFTVIVVQKFIIVSYTNVMDVFKSLTRYTYKLEVTIYLVSTLVVIVNYRFQGFRAVGFNTMVLLNVTSPYVGVEEWKKKLNGRQ